MTKLQNIGWHVFGAYLSVQSFACTKFGEIWWNSSNLRNSPFAKLNPCQNKIS